MDGSVDSFVSDCGYMVVIYTGVCMMCFNKYYQVNDGWFTYYVNISTGQKKFKLDKDDILIDYHPDDFWR